MNLRQIISVALCGAVAAAGSFASDPAQQTQNKNTQQPVQVAERTQWQNSDHMFATCVAIGNQEEIVISRFAIDKTKNNDVKDFANMMVKDHQAFLMKLQKFAPEASREGYLMENASADGSRRTSGTPTTQQPGAVTQARAQAQGTDVNVKVGNIQQTAGTVNPQGQQFQHVDFMALHRELAENCIQQAKQGMSKKEGNEFDECFIGHQIVKHEEMKNALTVFQRHTQGELKQIFADGLSTTDKHLKRRKKS